MQPHNDMQVLLTHQHLGGPVTNMEVVLPVAEGNHWQWELGSNDVSENVMPSEMAERIPRASFLLSYFQTLDELGLLTR